jgi:hypothetical protein
LAPLWVGQWPCCGDSVIRQCVEVAMYTPGVSQPIPAQVLDSACMQHSCDSLCAGWSPPGVWRWCKLVCRSGMNYKMRFGDLMDLSFALNC